MTTNKHLTIRPEKLITFIKWCNLNLELERTYYSDEKGFIFDNLGSSITHRTFLIILEDYIAGVEVLRDAYIKELTKHFGDVIDLFVLLTLPTFLKLEGMAKVLTAYYGTD